MKIKAGYNDKETIIKIQGRTDGMIELWIEETGVEDSREHLSYMTANELLELIKEAREAARRVFGIETY